MDDLAMNANHTLKHNGINQNPIDQKMKFDRI